MLTVELDVCSGMPNPTWSLSIDEEKDLLDRIMANPQQMKPVNAGLSHLGYRGMIVSLTKEDDGPWTKMRSYTRSQTPNGGLPTEFRVFGDLSDSVDNVEKWFVETSDKSDSEVDDFLREFLAGGFTFPVGQQLEGIFTGNSEESFGIDDLVAPAGFGMSCGQNYFSGTDFSPWNGSSYIGRNNCYNFAANHRTNTFAQPGRKSRVSNGMSTYGSIDTTQFLKAVRADGWKDSCDPSRNLSVVVVFMPYSGGTNPLNDYHWYRKVTSSGTWGHKPGQGSARFTDSSGTRIINPLSCNRKFWFNNKWYPGYTMTSTSWYFYWDNNYALVG